MSFIEQLEEFSNRIQILKDTIQTEEATKTSIVLPFFQLLGYDIFNPLEFVPEYTADAGTKKGEKVDYAILQNNEPIIIIEVKPINTDLNSKHLNQLFRYFTVTKARFSILTNGIIYKFFSDLDETNKMDMIPFLEINLLNIKDTDINELLKFKKDDFNVKNILSSASELKYTSLVKAAISEQFNNPTDQFVKALITKDIYPGVKTQAVIDKFRVIVKSAMNEYINKLLNEKFKSVMSGTEVLHNESNMNELEFLPEELEVLNFIANLLNISTDVVTFKKTTKYAYMHVYNYPSKWICRVTIRNNDNLLKLHKFEQFDFETEYIFNDITQLKQIKDILDTVYTTCIHL